MDFGLVLPEFDVNGKQRVAGSPPYMAPEALLNTAEPGSGHLADIYGLGVLAGRLEALAPAPGPREEYRRDRLPGR